jgi:hypothetical protein
MDTGVSTWRTSDRKLAITVDPDPELPWEGAQLPDILAVCRSVADCFATAISERAIEPIWLSTRTRNPRTRYVRTPKGEVQVLLSQPARQRRWVYYAYQFAHELCHVMANLPLEFDGAAKKSQWIEEAICETCSLYALRVLARRWEFEPPYPNWRPYAVQFSILADERLTHADHQLPSGRTFQDWLADAVPLMEGDGSRRADHCVVAGWLLPYFEKNPNAWCAIRYLNLWQPSVGTKDYFGAWRSVAPDRLHSVIDEIERTLFGAETTT